MAVSHALSPADHAAIRDLRVRFSDAANRRSFDEFAALFAEEGTWSIPDMQVTFDGRPAIRGGVEHMLGLWEFFVQFVHDGPIDVGNDVHRATGRSYIQEMGRFATGGSQFNCSFYDDEYVREGDRWKFLRRTYHFLYVDETSLPGRAMPWPAAVR